MDTPFLYNLVGEVGVEPTQLESNGFTDRPSSPTLALAYIHMELVAGVEPTTYGLQIRRSTI